MFITLRESHSTVLADISAIGARLRGARLPPIGEELVLSIDEVRTFGVIWAEGDECGIAFDCPLATDEEQLLRQKVAETHDLPPDINAAYDISVVGCGR